MLRTLAIAVMLAACTTPHQDIPDASIDAQQQPDARAPDAAPPPDARPEQPCQVGNLPYSRTITVDDSDPVPSQLLDEIEDVITGDKRQVFTKNVFPKLLQGTTWTPGVVTAAGVQRFAYTSTAATPNTTFEIPVEAGERLLGFSFYACGDGVADVSGSVNYVPNFTTDSGAFGLFSFAANNTPAAWTLITSTVIAPAVPALDTSFIVVAPTASAAGYSISMFKCVFDRP